MSEDTHKLLTGDIVSFDPTMAYSLYPLELCYLNKITKEREWKLIIQSTPKPAIILKGAMPTREEMALVLINFVSGQWAVDTFMTLCELAERKSLANL